jgi:hypothetical protein
VRLTPDPATRRPDPDPLQSDLGRIVLGGMVVWAVLFVVALVARPWLDEQDAGWLVWVPVWGVGLGFVGLPWARRNSG